MLLIEQAETASKRMGDPDFREAWRRLHESCPWATVFQAPAFVLCWFNHYSDQYEPLIVCEQEERNGHLTGLLVLGQDRLSGELVHAGAHQAEYHSWLAAGSADGGGFIGHALSLLRQHFPRARLMFHFLPADTPIDWLAERPWRGLIDLRPISRPLIQTVSVDEIDARLRKSSNRSRLKRLEREAGTALEPLIADQAIAMPDFLPRIAKDYDTRQNEANGCRPFAQDPRKFAFHQQLLAEGVLKPFALRAGDRLVGAVLAYENGNELAVAIYAYDQELAAHSPGKFVMHFLCREASAQGFAAIDLTPGGLWKQRFATANGAVSDLTIHFWTPAAIAMRADRILRKVAKKLLGRKDC